MLVNGAMLTEGAPDEIAADPLVREVYLGDTSITSGLPMAEPLLSSKACAAAMARPWC